MKKPIIIFGMSLVVCASSVLCWGQQEGQSGVGHIKGMVSDAVTHQPLGYVRVILELARYGYVEEVNTGAQGEFEFQHLNRAVYVVRVMQPGYKGAAQRTNTCDPAGCKRVDLTAGGMDYITFNLVPLPSNEAPAVPPGAPGASVSKAELQVPEAARMELDKGKKLASAGKAGDSIGHFKKAIDLYPAYEQAYFQMGLAYMDLQNLKDAENALLRATELNPNNGAAFLALGTAYANEKNFASAEKPLVRGLELDPDFAEGHCELSLTYWALERFPESTQHAQRCAALKPDNAQAHLLLGNLALAKRDQPGALREYREYLRLDPQGPYAAAARQQIERLEKALSPLPPAK